MGGSCTIASRGVVPRAPPLASDLCTVRTASGHRAVCAAPCAATGPLSLSPTPVGAGHLIDRANSAVCSKGTRLSGHGRCPCRGCTAPSGRARPRPPWPRDGLAQRERRERRARRVRMRRSRRVRTRWVGRRRVRSRTMRTAMRLIDRDLANSWPCRHDRTRVRTRTFRSLHAQCRARSNTHSAATRDPREMPCPRRTAQASHCLPMPAPRAAVPARSRKAAKPAAAVCVLPLSQCSSLYKIQVTTEGRRVNQRRLGLG